MKLILTLTISRWTEINVCLCHSSLSELLKNRRAMKFDRLISISPQWNSNPWREKYFCHRCFRIEFPIQSSAKRSVEQWKEIDWHFISNQSMMDTEDVFDRSLQGKVLSPPNEEWPEMYLQRCSPGRSWFFYWSSILNGWKSITPRFVLFTTVYRVYSFLSLLRRVSLKHP